MRVMQVSLPSSSFTFPRIASEHYYKHRANSMKSIMYVFVADGINSVGDYNSPPGGCRVFVSVSVSVSPPFFHVSRLDNF